MVSILQGVGSSDVLLNAKFVCKSWHSLCKDPHVSWQVVELRRDVLSDKILKKGFRPLAYREMDKVFEKMAMQVVDLSSGQLLDLWIQGFGSNHLLQYIYQRLQDDGCLVSGSIKLQVEDSIYYEGLSHMLRNLPLLEDLELPFTTIFDCQAIAIAKYMPGLRKLQLFGNTMTVVGLMAILDNCRHLEYLDLRQCYSLCEVLNKESNDLKTRLRQQIKQIKGRFTYG